MEERLAIAEQNFLKAQQLAKEKKFEKARKIWAEGTRVEHVASMVSYASCLLKGIGMSGGVHNGSKVGFG